MVVTVEEIRDEGLTLDTPIRTEFLQAALAADGKDTGFRAVSEAKLHAEFHKVSGGVLLRGKLEAELAGPCKRCLTDVVCKVPVSFTLNLVPRDLFEAIEGGDGDDDEATDRAGSFEIEDADEELFDGRRIDLDPIVREQVLLALPMQVVCREDCEGLCLSCGQNLNEAKCSCERKVPDPRLAVLKDIKLN